MVGKLKYLISVVLLSVVFDAQSSKNILLINSYHVGFSWTDEITEGVRKTLNTRDDISLYIEYIDSKRFNQENYFTTFKSYLLEKYKDTPFKVVITSDNDALNFVLNNEIDHLWNIPVVFCGISNYLDYKLEDNNLWGVIETDEWYPVIKTILDIHHNENFYFIVENSPTGEIRKKKVLSAAEELTGKVRVFFIENYDYNSIIQEIKKITGNSIIYYHGIGIDYFNNPVNPEKLGEAIIHHSNVPVYSSYRNVIGKGAVGGFLGSGVMQGVNSSEIALKLVDQVSPSLINKVTIPSGQFIFDYKVANKLGLDMNNFPKESVVLNKPDPLLKNYRKEVFSTVAFIVIQLFVIILLINNIIKRTKAEKLLIENQKKFSGFAEILPQTVFECDLNGKFTFVNDHGLKTFGYTKEELLLGMNMLQVFSGEECKKIKESLEKCINDKANPPTILCNARRKDNSTFPFEIHFSLIIKDDAPVGITGIGINVTKQKLFEKELIIARKKAEESDRLKSAFLANMSHEIRTPLNSIVGFSYLMAERSLDEEEIKRMSFFIKNSSDHLLMLINDIIDISKIEAGQLNVSIKKLDVNEIMNEIHQYLIKEKSMTEKEKIEVVLEKPGKEQKVLIESDALRLKQILLNLTGNSLKFTEEGYIKIGYELDGSNIIFHVKDTGIGINDDLKCKIFERFSKGSSLNGKLYPGFGLGLSISKQLAELLKGRLWFEDNKKGGTIFYLSLPLN